MYVRMYMFNFCLAGVGSFAYFFSGIKAFPRLTLGYTWNKYYPVAASFSASVSPLVSHTSFFFDIVLKTVVTFISFLFYASFCGHSVML